MGVKTTLELWEGDEKGRNELSVPENGVGFLSWDDETVAQEMAWKGSGARLGGPGPVCTVGSRE